MTSNTYSYVYHSTKVWKRNCQPCHFIPTWFVSQRNISRDSIYPATYSRLVRAII